MRRPWSRDPWAMGSRRGWRKAVRRALQEVDTEAQREARRGPRLETFAEAGDTVTGNRGTKEIQR